jgi:hypothetical protein
MSRQSAERFGEKDMLQVFLTGAKPFRRHDSMSPGSAPATIAVHIAFHRI